MLHMEYRYPMAVRKTHQASRIRQGGLPVGDEQAAAFEIFHLEVDDDEGRMARGETGKCRNATEGADGRVFHDVSWVEQDDKRKPLPLFPPSASAHRICAARAQIAGVPGAGLGPACLAGLLGCGGGWFFVFVL